MSRGIEQERGGLNYSIYYRTWHSEDPEHVEMMVSSAAAMLGPLLDGITGSEALDGGCGFGFASLALARLGFDVTAVEHDANQADVAERLGVRVLRMSLQGHLQQPRAQYSVVTLLDVLEHVPVVEQVDLMRSVRDALTEGGRCILTVPNANSPLAARWRYGDFTHYTSFTEHSLRFVLLNAGFTSVDILPSAEPRRRPPVKIWTAPARQALRHWMVRKAWRQVLIAELGDREEARAAPLDLNLTCVAHV